MNYDDRALGKVGVWHGVIIALRTSSQSGIFVLSANDRRLIGAELRLMRIGQLFLLQNQMLPNGLETVFAEGLVAIPMIARMVMRCLELFLKDDLLS